MKRRSMVIALGCLAVVAGLVSTAEAGGRKRPGTTPAPAAGTRVTVVNKTGMNLYTVIFVPPPFLPTVGQANAKGGKVVNAGATSVFTNLTPGENTIDLYDVSALGTPLTDSTSLVRPDLGGGQALEDSVTAVKDKNVTLEVTTAPGTGFITVTPK